ncbi:MAG: hypothetical protein MJ237_08995 [bacterium]|nr:hypothetical protein [bacterium]
MPSFRSGGFFNFAGNVMQGIQNGGFFVSFLIQDALGMTAPRVITGFKRDKEVTGELNYQEGMEVLLREAITGPTMMAIAPAMMVLAAKFGKTTSVNTKIIKRLGKHFKEYVSNSKFNKELLNDKSKFKTEYMKQSVKDILENTVGKENVSDKNVDYIMNQISNYTNIPENIEKKGLRWKSKYKNSCLDNITKHINDITYSKSKNLDLLEKVKLGVGNDTITVNTREAFESLMKYSDDAIISNKNLASLNSEAAENVMDTAIAKRAITNITTVATTLGILSVIPKIYARSDISPSAKTAEKLKNSESEQNITDKQTENISFKGKGHNSSSILSKLGKFLREHLGDRFATEMEYDGINFTNTLMAVLSVFGLLLPRGLRAYNRAQIDENGKRDKSEICEILIRDLSSALSVIFAVPMLTRAFVSAYENKVGFVLMQKDRTKTGFKKTLDLINPMSKSHVFSNKELEALYGNVNSKEKMLNLCEYVNKNNGDIQKILEKSEFVSEVFNEKTLNLTSLNNLSKAEKNSKIIEFFKNKAVTDEAITKMMNGIENSVKNNKILACAKGMNSIPACISMFLISPFILGIFIPELTYANSRRMHRKQEQKNKTITNA